MNTQDSIVFGTTTGGAATTRSGDLAAIPTQLPQVAAPQISIAGGSHPHNVFHPPPGYVMAPWFSNQYLPPIYGMQPHTGRLTHIAPRPQVEMQAQTAASSSSRPPDFIEAMQTIRKQLYELANIPESQEPPEGEVYSRWRKLVSQQYKPVSN